jgi:Domain of unknown function (DUF4180)
VGSLREKTFEVHGKRIYELSAKGSLLATGQDAVDLIGAAKSAGAAIAAIPIQRLAPAFFELKTGVAGEMVQKFVTYGLTVAVLGDTTQLATVSKSLHDFLYESNQRGSVWFLRDGRALEDRLANEKK